MAIAFFLFFATDFQVIAGPSYNLFEENGKVGLKNESGEILIPASYEALGWSEGSLTAIGSVIGYKLNGQWGLIDLNNHRITPPQYFSLIKGNHDLVIATKQSPLTFRITSGCINTTGKEIIPFDYTGIKLHDLRAVVFVLDGNVFKYGMIDHSNKTLIPIQFRSITPIGSLRFAVENFDRKTAIYNDLGKPVTSFTIDSISTFAYNHAIFYQNGLQGLINRDGLIIQPAKFSEIKNENGKILARVPSEWQILSGDNKLIETIQGDSLVQLDQTIFKIVKGDVSSLVNDSFQPITNQTYHSIGSYINGRAVVVFNRKKGIVNREGKQLLPCQYSALKLLQETITGSENSLNDWSLFDNQGNKKTYKNYDAILEPTDRIYPVIKKGYWGAINEQGREIISCVYDSILEIKNNLIAVKFKGQYGIISTNEDWVVTPKQNKIILLNTNRYFEKSGDMLFLKSFSNYTYYFTINPIEVKSDCIIERTSFGAKWTINFDGQIIKREEPHYEPVEKVFEASEGLRGIKKDGKYGFIDDRGRLRIANRYEGIKPFSEGLAAIKILGKWGFISHDERIVIQPSFEEVMPYSKGYSLIKQNGKFGLIDTKGQLVLPARYEHIKILDTHRFLLFANGAYGLADENGNIILQLKYESITDLGNNYIIVKQGGKKGVVTTQSLSTIPLHFDEIKFDALSNRFFALKKSEWVQL